MERFSHEVSISMNGRGGEEEFLVEIDFACTPPVPERRPSLDDPGAPAEGGELEIITVSALRNAKGESLECPRWLNDAICRLVDEDDLRDSVEWRIGPPDYDRDEPFEPFYIPEAA